MEPQTVGGYILILEQKNVMAFSVWPMKQYYGHIFR